RERHAEVAVPGLDLRDQRVGLVQLLDAPALGAAEPAEGLPDHDPEAERVPAGVVLLADVRVVDVADAVIGIEVHEQLSVADGRVRGHGRGLSGRTILAAGSAAPRRRSPPRGAAGDSPLWSVTGIRTVKTAQALRRGGEAGLGREGLLVVVPGARGV